MGPIWSMTPASPGTSSETAYFWHDPRPMTFTVTVTVNGTQVTQTSFSRSLSAAPVASSAQSLKADGFIGAFYQPTASASGQGRRRPAVLYLGGSGGGMPGSLLGVLLASHGYDALGVGYFGLPGLPSALANIPLEYFARALHWLAAQPGVDPAKIAVLGISRGSEAAQLLGVHYPSLVHAVIASVPSDAAICSYPDCDESAWTFGGKPVPYTAQFDNPAPSDTAALIQDQKINGPVFLDCGESDNTWTSCPYARAIAARLDAARDPWQHVLYAYPGAGHYVGAFVPYEPVAASVRVTYIPSYSVIQEAEPSLWQHLLAFLAGFATR
jgi:dienelactone hydrolase